MFIHDAHVQIYIHVYKYIYMSSINVYIKRVDGRDKQEEQQRGGRRNAGTPRSRLV